MTSDRPYRKAMPHADAMAELTGNAGTQFDPEVVQALVGYLFGRRQAGSRRSDAEQCRLATGRALGQNDRDGPGRARGRRRPLAGSFRAALELADLEDLGAAVGARALNRRATVLHGHLLRDS